LHCAIAGDRFPQIRARDIARRRRVAFLDRVTDRAVVEVRRVKPVPAGGERRRVQRTARSNAASLTIANVTTTGDRRAHSSVHVGSTHDVLVQDLKVENPSSIRAASTLARRRCRTSAPADAPGRSSLRTSASALPSPQPERVEGHACRAAVHPGANHGRRGQCPLLP